MGRGLQQGHSSQITRLEREWNLRVSEANAEGLETGSSSGNLASTVRSIEAA